MKNFELKYKSALGNATTMYACAKESNDEKMIQSLELVFPELKKTKDELINEELIHFLETCQDTRFVGNRKRDEWISWLKKQGQKPQGKTALEAAKEEKVDDANKVEPKFKIGDWVVQKGLGIYKIIEVCASWYEVISYNDGNQYSISFDMEKDCHIWTIQDAKDGDVLASDIGSIILVKESRGSSQGYRLSYRAVLYDDTFELREFYVDPEKFFPATKEQHDLLFQKMKEAGYEWDSEKKELREIKHKFRIGDIICCGDITQPIKITGLSTDSYQTDSVYNCIPFSEEDKWELITSWNEKDENMLSPFLSMLNWIKGSYISVKNAEEYEHWLQSLKQRLNGYGN